jgi:hypothetical protein
VNRRLTCSQKQLLAFDAALKKKIGDALKQMWAPIEAFALLLNENTLGGFISK